MVFAPAIDIGRADNFQCLPDAGCGLLADHTSNAHNAQQHCRHAALAVEVSSDMGILALLDAYIIGVNHWFERGEISLEDRDELVEDAELIILGITLLSEEPVI